MSENNKPVQLTDEQRARIAENRRQALERQQARRLVNSSIIGNTSNNSTTKIVPSKVLATSHRVNPYSKPPVKNVTNNQVFNSNFGSFAQSPKPQIAQPSKTLLSYGFSPNPKMQYPQTAPKPLNVTVNNQKSFKCTMELMNGERFLVKTVGYDEKVVQEFKKIKSNIYHRATRNWSFHMADYKQLVKGLDSLTNVKTEKLPEFVVKNLLTSTEVPDESCLSQIEKTLVNSLIDFQRSGVCFGISKQGRCMIADDMGLGKSRQAIGIADFYRDDWPLLIITNASTRQFWAAEAEKLLPYLTFNDIHIIQSPRDCYDLAKIVICSYNSLQGNIDDLLRIKFGVVIFDESHNLKNTKAKQTKNAEIISKNAERIIMLTGTPALSRPVELYPQLKILDDTFATYHQFTGRYCDAKQTPYGWNASGSSNLEELNILLKKKFMIRRVKSDVFLELSAKNRELVMLENYKQVQVQEWEDEMQEFFSQFQDANINNKDTEEILLKWYQSTSQVKAYGACTFVKKYLEENDCKILVFAHHTFMMNALCGELEKVNIQHIRIDGSVRGDIRAERVECFQTNPNIRAAVLSIRACNAGITLTAATTVIFCEFDWNPSTIIQAEARAHRIGQENEVKIYYLLASKTVDDVIWNLLQEKQKKLGKAGLVSNVENLGDNIKVSKFDVQKMSFQEKSQPSSKEQKTPIDYFKDDDIDDEEFLRMVENLP